MIKRVPFNAVQKALYALLSKGQTVPVYDKIPTGSEKMPYIWLGEFHGTPAVQNKTSVQHLISQELDIWSDGKGKKEVNSIMDDVVALVTSYQLAMDGYRQLTVDVTLYQTMGERYENGSSAYHGVLMLEYLIEQLT